MKDRFFNFKFYIDRGGTFTDIYAEYSASLRGAEGDEAIHSTKILKLLSVDPANYADAPREAIRRVLYEVLEDEVFASPSKAFPSFGDNFIISEIRMGTTIATNALLERKGIDCALLITKGFKDLLEIGYQDRPKIFDLAIKKPELLYKEVLEIDERIVPAQFYSHKDGYEVIKELDLAILETDLKRIYDSGIRSLAVVLLHSYACPEHEKQIAKLAYKLGFTNVSLSSEVMPMIKVVPRGDTTLIDAYLTPLIHNYIKSFKSGFSDGLKNTELLFMKSDAGLCLADDFRGANSILSGPAGGVVGYSSLRGTEGDEAIHSLIGFDMGGTSTDVSRFAGDYELSFFTELAGLRIQSPQLEINTVAAGGGSRLYYENGIFKVGPESSGAHPGPVCYKKKGYLSITDANLVLGRLIPEFFPKVFGSNANEAIDKDLAIAEFKKLQTNLAAMSIEDIALGFVKVANEVMARPIREISVMKGYALKDHILVCFGGAGAQHACALARDLGISKILVHKYSGILSAYGIGLADRTQEKQIAYSAILNSDSLKNIETKFIDLISSLDKKYNYIIEKFLNLRYIGTNTSFMIKESVESSYQELFEEKYLREFGFKLNDREILVDDIRIRAILKSSSLERSKISKSIREPQPKIITKTYFGSWLETPVYLLNDLGFGDKISGPAIIMQDTATVLVEPFSEAFITELGDIEITLTDVEKTIVSSNFDPINLSIFSSRFMSIAEQMGKTLEKTAISTNIKERRDFSCALFDKDGNLVANAPHQPVHLGSMGHCVRQIINKVPSAIKPGNSILTNHPQMGGSHLPDLTVVTPVFITKPSLRGAESDEAIPQSELIFFVANRGHHADVGGISPGSMPAFSTSLDQEGIAIKHFKLVENGEFQETKLRELFSTARSIEDNVSDLRAQVASNNKGIELIRDLINSYSLEVVLSYMQHIQANAEEAVRDLLKAVIASEAKQSILPESLNESGLLRRFTPRNDGTCILTANDFLDDGSEIKLQITLNPNDGSAIFDFTGTASELKSNLNTPIAVTSSAILYAMRALINKEIPLNQGCLKPIQIIIPENCILNPSENAAVVGGNVQTSQRIVDVIFKAFGACAASQGCMNNVIFGNDKFGYYETVGGGAGAGPTWHGASGVHTHMTNTRITDPEILETRYPIILREFSLRKNSGGAGKHKGGDGLIREFEFLEDLNLSILTERRVYEPYGMAGGEAGTKGLNQFINKEGEEKLLSPKAELGVKPGDRFRIYTPGGGGYGSG